RSEALLQAAERRLLSTKSSRAFRDEIKVICVSIGDLPSVLDHRITKEEHVRHYHIVGIGLLGVILATGCAGNGERIDLSVPVPRGGGEGGGWVWSPSPG